MLLTFRLLVIALVMMGVAVGVSFGVGVAYGKGDTKTVNSGLTEAQIAQIVGGGVGTTGGGNFANRTGTPAAGTTPGAGGNNAFANNTTGQITAVDAQSITLTTAQGASVKVSIGSNTTVQTLSTGKATDLKVGDSIIVAGTRGTDGTVAATSVSAVPSLLQGLLSGNFGGGGANQRPAAQATP